MLWLILLAFHLVGWVGFNLLLRRSVLARLDKVLLATIMQTGIAIPALFLLALHPPEFQLFAAADYGLIAGAISLTIALQLVNVKALQYLEASVFSVLYNLRIVFTTILGIVFLNESFVGLRVLGGLCILLAIFVVRQRGSQSRWHKGIEWGIGAAFILSWLTLFEKELVNSVGFINFFPLVSVVSALLLWGYVLRARPDFDRQLIWQPRMLQLMTLRAVSAFGFSGALAAGALISVANYISGMGVIFMVLFGALWLGERDYLRRKILATAVAVTGLTLVLISGL